jgi:4a-hydroxytetrahydrobiopterin dehydratase
MRVYDATLPLMLLEGRPAMPQPLSAAAVAAALCDLPGWSRDGDRLTRTFKFHHFKEAMGFLVRVGFEAESLNHHPELYNVYATVRVMLSTHDAGDKITEKDIELAQRIQAFNWT